MVPWLSILIPVYNVQDYLVECLVSVVKQCDSQIEIIVLDDKSTDGSLRVLNEFAASSHHPLKILQHPTNMGLSAARNSLLESAEGEYIWFLDSDDALNDGAVAELQSVVRQHSPELVLCDYRIWRTEGSSTYGKAKKERHVKTFAGPANELMSNPDQLFIGMYTHGKLHSWSKIAKRSLWAGDLQFPKGKYFEDMVVTPRLALRATTFYYSPSVWVLYRQREGSILAVPNPKKIDDMSSGVEGVLDLWVAKHPRLSAEAKFKFILYCVKVYFFTVKELKRIGLNNDERVEHYRASLLRNIKIDKLSLMRLYLIRGEFFRLFKLMRYI